MRKGIIVGGMVLGLLMGCNNGGEDSQKVFLKSVVSLGSNFLDVFTSFGKMVGGVLGFKEEPKKSEVGNYFKKIKDTVQGTKDKLSEIINNMEQKGNPNTANAKGAVNKLVSETLDKIIDGAKKASDAIGNDATDPIGNVAATGTNAGIAGKDIENLVKGIKEIVDVVLKGKGSATAGDDKGPVQDGSLGAAGAPRGSGGGGANGVMLDICLLIIRLVLLN